MHMPTLAEYPIRRKDEGDQSNEIAYPIGYRISRVEENYYLRASRWLRTYLLAI